MQQQRVRIYENGAPSVMKYETSAAIAGGPGNGQVKLVHEAIGVNFVDTLFRSGAFGVSLPFDMGVEGAGVVESVGDGVQGWKSGDRAAYFFTPGAYSNMRLIDAGVLVKLPDDIASDVAASLLTKGLTAWMLIKRVHVVKPGDIVLVHGAAGGVGSLVAQWAKSLGATVIATVGSPSKAQGVRNRGIDHVLVTDDPEFLETVNAITGGRGVDAVYEFVGKATFALSAAVLRSGGTLAHVGNASGAPAADDKAGLPGRGIRYVQPATSQYVGERSSLDEASTDVFAAYRAGVFGTIEPTRYALSDVVRAHEDIASRSLVGPAILIP
ncbi:quinone oxidoreductase [Noviherbaspirillum sp. CPCC 100848]|uniref:Quinone oxidoreductase n=1 Tax=Noviherbaspirillum album TaxID=3080276 RepID=A0ABU6JGM1_9BURK|nr:quinone oxidoreductase [Noviherbaspirillum sp. CPCC 100848]MEC4722670.1 quinone oxidoreductase [Noviherbaspirillum sp. CPCC 100848]